MNDTPEKDTGPGESPAQSRRREREARLAEALRANLKRRKAQERGRNDASESATGTVGKTGDDAG